MITLYRAYITRIQNLRKHTNADRLQCGECFGNTVIVDLSTQPEELGVYFPTDGKLGLEYATKNNLLRRKDADGNNVGGYLDPVKRNIRAMKLRGEKSDGLFMPLKSLESFTDISKLKEGDTITVLNGVTICEKYIPKVQTPKQHGGGNRVRKHKEPIAPLFAEHADTEQLAYNLSAFHPGDLVEITLKMHGTSQRTGYLPKLSGHKRSFMDWLLRRPGKPIYEYGYVTGTRRTVLDDFEDGGYYGNNSFREPHAEAFEGKLHKGETVYYEVVGFTDNGKPIMPSCPNKKVNDKEFIKQYGETTTFSYGCDPTGSITIDASGLLDGGFPNAEKAVSVQKEVPVHDCYVYRMTMTNEDGDVVEYTPDFMRYRCQQMGVKCVPVFYCGFVPSETAVATAGYRDVPEWVKDRAERYYDGPDPIGKTHVREGVVARIVNRPSFAAFKHKNFSFKALEGLIKETAAAPDLEEAEELADAADEET